MTTLVDALSRMTVDQLKPLVAWRSEGPPKGRKDELIGGIVRGLSASGLRLLWSGLDDLQRLAVAQALYAGDNAFHSDQFRAQYGRLPAFTTEARPGTRTGSGFVAKRTLGQAKPGTALRIRWQASRTGQQRTRPGLWGNRAAPS